APPRAGGAPGALPPRGRRRPRPRRRPGDASGRIRIRTSIENATEACGRPPDHGLVIRFPSSGPSHVRHSLARKGAPDLGFGVMADEAANTQPWGGTTE